MTLGLLPTSCGGTLFANGVRGAGMDQYEFLGLPQSQWAFINTFADWFSAFATIAAVWLSLWLARKATQPKARLRCAVVITIGNGFPRREYVNFSIVNTGDRPIRVTNIGWKLGLFKKRFAVQMPGGEPHINSPLPVDLTHSQTANWFVSTEDVHDGENWLQDFGGKMIAGRSVWLNLLTLRAQAYTSTGHVFSVKPSRDLIKLLHKAVRDGVAPK